MLSSLTLMCLLIKPEHNGNSLFVDESTLLCSMCCILEPIAPREPRR